ncbi:MAG TPA: hypothetical protein C5S50_05895 [Methanosarcinaceae archaeon]|nr:hypothetical protein [Methanosarcinaceae archaeon]
MWEILILISILFLAGGFLVLRDKGVTFRKWLFISILAVLFMMMAAYGAQLIADWYYPSAGYYVPGIREERAFIEGLTLISFGIVGLILLIFFQKKDTEELNISFGMAGAILLIVGLIDLLQYEEALAKFIVAAIGVVTISFFMYRYRSFLLGEK